MGGNGLSYRLQGKWLCLQGGEEPFSGHTIVGFQLIKNGTYFIMNLIQSERFRWIVTCNCKVQWGRGI